MEKHHGQREREASRDDSQVTEVKTVGVEGGWGGRHFLTGLSLRRETMHLKVALAKGPDSLNECLTFTSVDTFRVKI